MHTCFDSVFIFTICEKKYEIFACIINVYTGKNNRFPFLDILGYLKNTHKNPKFGRVRQVPPRKLVGNSLVGTCLTLPNLGFLWVFFKYPKLGYLKDSNAAAHSVDTGIECPMYMLESTRIFTISL